jgi:hypothetical protein
MDDATLSALQANYTKMAGGLQMPQQQAEQPKKRSGWMNLIPVATSVLGGIAGTFAAPGVGTAAGGAAGGALGEWLTQKLSGEKSNTGKILTEGAFGALGGIGKGARAIKGATTAVRAGEGAAAGAKILRYGAPAVSTVAKEGAETAAKGGIRGWMGNKLLGAADDTALRASQLSGKKEALKGFDKRFGEDLGTYLRKNNLIGKTGKDVEETIIKKLGGEFSDEVGKIGRNITGSDIIAANQKSLSKLLSNTSSAGVKLKDDVAKELQEVLAREGGSITPARLNAIKAEFQANARNAYKLGANAKPGVDAKVAEYLKKTLQNVSGSNKLATTGKELDKAYKAADLLASAAQNGRGTLSLGLTDLLAAGAGGTVASLPGAVAAVGAKKAWNNPRTQAFIANKLASTGEKLVGGAAAKAAVAPVVEQGAMGTAKSMLKAQAAPRIISAAAGGAVPQQGADGGMEMNPNSPFNPSSPNYNPALVDPNAVGDPNDIGTVMGAEESPYSMQAMQADIMRDPKNADQYAKIYELMNPQAAQADLSQTSRSALASSDNAINTLDQLESLFTSAGGGSGRIGGKLKGLAASAGLDENARVYNNLSQASVTQFAKALAGAGSGTVSDMDAKVILAAIPTISDTKAEAAAKFAALRQRLENAKGNTMMYGSGGGSDLQSMMMAQ